MPPWFEGGYPAQELGTLEFPRSVEVVGTLIFSGGPTVSSATAASFASGYGRIITNAICRAREDHRPLLMLSALSFLLALGVEFGLEKPYIALVPFTIGVILQERFFRFRRRGTEKKGSQNSDVLKEIESYDSGDSQEGLSCPCPPQELHPCDPGALREPKMTNDDP